MHFLAYVLGDDPDKQLKKFISHEHEYVVGRKIRNLVEDGTYKAPTKVLDEIRKAMGAQGKVAIVEHDRVAVDCPQLYHAGFEHFLTIKDGTFCTVNRILLDNSSFTDEEREEFNNLRDNFSEGEHDIKWDTRDVSKFISSIRGDSIYLESYEMGGMWANRLIAKPGAVGERNKRVVRLHDDTRYDSLRIKDIDFDRMYKEWAAPFEEQFAAFEKIRAGRRVLTRPQMTQQARDAGRLRDGMKSEEYGKAYDAVMADYNAQPVIKDLKAAGYEVNKPIPEIWGYESYMKHHVNPLKVPFAFAHNGVWKQRGVFEFMGIIEETVDIDDWDQQFEQLLKTLDPNTLLTVVDCHR